MDHLYGIWLHACGVIADLILVLSGIDPTLCLHLREGGVIGVDKMEWKKAGIAPR